MQQDNEQDIWTSKSRFDFLINEFCQHGYPIKPENLDTTKIDLENAESCTLLLIKEIVIVLHMINQMNDNTETKSIIDNFISFYSQMIQYSNKKI